MKDFGFYFEEAIREQDEGPTPFDRYCAVCGAPLSPRVEGNLASVRVPDAKVIPEEYLIPQEPKVDKDAIYKAFKAGEEIAGAELVQTEGVRIG